MAQPSRKWLKETVEMIAAAEEYKLRKKIVDALIKERSLISTFKNNYESNIEELSEVFREEGESTIDPYYDSYVKQILDDVKKLYEMFNGVDLVINLYCKAKLNSAFPKWVDVKNNIFAMFRFFSIEYGSWGEQNIPPEMRNPEYFPPSFNEDKLTQLSEMTPFLDDYLRLIDEVVVCVKEPMAMLQANATKYMRTGFGKPPRVHAPRKFVEVNTIRRNRFEAPQKIVRQALKDVEKISKIPYKKMSLQKSSMLYWGDNPVKDVPSVLIDLPIIEIPTLRKRDVRKDVIFHTIASMKKEGFKMINKGCIVVHNGEILTIYITGKEDKALSESAKHLYDLGRQFTEYYPRKDPTFYTHSTILLEGNPTLKEKRAFKEAMRKVEKTERYYGWNALDGQIKYYSAPNHSAVIDYHPRKPEASFDDAFLYNLIFSYCALYMLEERYAPAVAKYRLMKAEQVEKAQAIPGVPLKDLPATSLGASENFASALHDDSGIKGITESIIWSKVGQDKESYFVNDQAKLAFDLSNENAMILIPPKVSHGTANTGEHGGFGFVIITKANLVFNTPLNKEWYGAWNDYLSGSLAKERFISSRRN